MHSSKLPVPRLPIRFNGAVVGSVHYITAGSPVEHFGKRAKSLALEALSFQPSTRGERPTL